MRSERMCLYPYRCHVQIEIRLVLMDSPLPIPGPDASLLDKLEKKENVETETTERNHD